MICDSTYVAGIPLGVLSVDSNWDEKFNRFNIDLNNNLDGASNIAATAKYYPKNKTFGPYMSMAHISI